MMEKAQKFQVIKICKNVLERNKTYCYNKTEKIITRMFYFSLRNILNEPFSKKNYINKKLIFQAKLKKTTKCF